MGYGHTGSSLAVRMVGGGDTVVVIEAQKKIIESLPRSVVDDGRISIVEGDGTNSDVLRRAEIEDADVFIAVSGSDTVNGLAGQKVKEIFGVSQVIVKVKNRVLAEIYEERGMTTLGTTEIYVNHVLKLVTRSR